MQGRKNSQKDENRKQQWQEAGNVHKSSLRESVALAVQRGHHRSPVAATGLHVLNQCHQHCLVGIGIPVLKSTSSTHCGSALGPVTENGGAATCQKVGCVEGDKEQVKLRRSLKQGREKKEWRKRSC